MDKSLKTLILLGITFIIMLIATSFFQGQFIPSAISKSHLGIKCSVCHEPFKGASANNCYGCHNSILLEKRNKKGIHGGIKKDNCIVCHFEHDKKVKEIAPDEYDHSFTSFSLVNHRQESCPDCHKNNYNNFNQTECLNCHQGIGGTDFSRHKSYFGSDCLECHNGGVQAKFSHKNKGFFTGSHLEADCSKCHSNGNKDKLSYKCSSCHESSHKNKWGDNCKSCHTATSWKKTNFYHSSQQNCSKCHSASTGHFKGACVTCHNTSNWKSAKFKHTSKTCQSCHKPPRGHYNSNCSSCHVNTRWKFNHPNSKSCQSCHRSPAGHYQSNCLSCHRSTSWRSATFEHPRTKEHSYRSFPCSSCHPNGFSSYNCTRCHESGNEGHDEHGERKDDD